MSRINLTVSALATETNQGRLARMLIAWGLMFLLATLWAALANPANAASLTEGGQSKGTPLDAPMCDPNWQIVSSGNVAPGVAVYLRGTDGDAPSDVWAVGYAETGQGTRAVIEHWDGTAWSLVSIPKIGSYSSALYAVRAIETYDVWAVGSYKDTSSPERTLIMRWNGTTWSIVSSPNVGTGANVLKGVHSLYSNNVFAVGYYAGGSTYWTLTMRWNGNSWSTLSSPNMGTMSRLEAVTMASSTHVWAVGRYVFGSTSYALSMKWNGSAWTILNFTAQGGVSLYGVAAASPTDVWAVGTRENCSASLDTCVFMMRWNGSQWTMSQPQPSHDGGRLNGLYGVRVVAANDVWAVGYIWSDSTNSYHTWAQRWNGTSWQRPGTSDWSNTNNILYGVGSAGAAHIWAVGYHGASDGLIQKWNGTHLSMVSSPTVNFTSSYLAAVDTTLSNLEGWAVGHSNTNGTNTLLIERRIGSGWQVLPTSAPPGNSLLTGVTVVSATDSWAVGTYNSGSSNRTLTLHWDGASWTTVSSPNAGPNNNVLNAVYSLDTNNVWAVGYSINGISLVQQTLILRWNGSAWSVVPSPNVGAGNNTLMSVAGTSANDVWAVGTHYNGTAIKTLVLHWDGTAWSVVASPNAGTSSSANFLSGITALTATDAWAVGNYATASGFNTLTMRWNGTAWNVVASPNAGVSSQLSGIDYASATGLWAVGRYNDGTTDRTLVEHWDGTAWSVVATPNTGQSANALNAVSVTSPTDVWAVGNYSAPLSTQTLAERFNPCP